jgi:hypothetical protein
MTGIEQHLLHLELRLLQPEVRSDPEALADLLDDGFREFGSSGRAFTRSDTVAAFQAETAPPPISITEFAAALPAPDVALVTYVAVSNDPALPDSRRSSVWVRRDSRGGRWRILFHQGTRIPG